MQVGGQRAGGSGQQWREGIPSCVRTRSKVQLLSRGFGQVSLRVSVSSFVWSWLDLNFIFVSGSIEYFFFSLILWLEIIWREMI